MNQVQYEMFDLKLKLVLDLLRKNQNYVVNDTHLETLLSVIESRFFGDNSVKPNTHPCPCPWPRVLPLESDCETSSLSVIDNFVIEIYEHSQEEYHETLPFALRLAGILLLHSTSLSSDKCSEKCIAIFEICRRDQVWQCASVRNSWLAGIHQLSHSKDFLPWLSLSGYLGVIHDCLEDKSIFVAKAAEKILVDFCLKLSESCEVNPQHLTVLDGQLKVLVARVLRDTSENSLLSSIRVLQDICYDSAICVRLLTENHGFKDILTNLIRIGDLKVFNCVLNLFKSMLLNRIDIDLESIVIDFLQDGRFQKAIKLGAMIYLCRPETETTARLKAVILSPITCLLRKPRPNGIDASVWQALASHLGHEKNACMLVKLSLNTIQDAVLKGLSINCLEAISDLISHRFFNSFAQKLIETTMSFLKSSKESVRSIMSALWTMGLQNSKASVLMCKVDDIYQLEKDLLNNTDTLLKMSETLLDTLNVSSADSTVTSKTLDCLVATFPAVCHHTSGAAVLDRLCKTLRQKSCDVQWEVRDCVVQAIGSLCQLMQANLSVEKCFCEEHLYSILCSSLKDGNSYVRASSLQSLGHLICLKQWQSLTGEYSSQEILDSILTTLKLDTEAFPRRAAIDLLRHWFHKDVPASEKGKILESVQEAITDFDWEVKMGALRFWKHIIQSQFLKAEPTMPSYLVACLSESEKVTVNKLEGSTESKFVQLCRVYLSLHIHGCLDLLLTTLDDCDRPVCAFAAELLLELQTYLQKVNLCFETFDKVVFKNDQYVVCFCELCEEKFTLHTEMQNGDFATEVSKVFGKIESSDFAAMIEDFSCTTDPYVLNPVSLLDDILALQQEGVIMDCY